MKYKFNKKYIKQKFKFSGGIWPFLVAEKKKTRAEFETPIFFGKFSKKGLF